MSVCVCYLHHDACVVLVLEQTQVGVQAGLEVMVATGGHGLPGFSEGQQEAALPLGAQLTQQLPLQDRRGREGGLTGTTLVCMCLVGLGDMGKK